MNKRKFLSVFAFGMIFSIYTPAARAEDMTITTYYPSPNGTYDALSVKRLSVGDTNADTYINASDVPATSGYLLVADRLGIGTTGPGTKLDVVGSNSSTIAQFLGKGTSAGDWVGIEFANSNNYYPAAIRTINAVSNPGYLNPRLGFFTLAANTYQSANLVERLSILADSGNVGIGTTTPDNKFQIQTSGGNQSGFALFNEYTGNGSTPYKFYMATDNGGCYGDGVNMGFYTDTPPSCVALREFALRINRNGNIGIGTTAPDTKLEVVTTDSTSGLTYTGNLRISSASPQLDFVDSDNNDWAIHVNSNKMYFIRDAWTYTDLVLNGSGNVSMGTDTPNANMKLQVTGEICSSTLGAAGGNIRMIAGNYGCFIRNDGAHTYFLLTNAGDQYGGWNSLRPLYINDATGYVTFGNGHGDLAENYRVSGKALRGSLMSVNSAIPSAAIKADPSRKSLLGVISTTPGAVMDTDGGFHIGYGTKSEYKNEKAPVVLAGAAPVLVTSKNGPISIGDPVGISSIPGFGAKAVAEGLTVGRALEVFNPKGSSCKTAASIDAIKWPEDNGKNSQKPCFKLPDGTYVGKIMVAVNVSWYDPSAGVPDPNKELIKEMRSSIADLTAAVKAQQQEIQVLKQEINKADRNQ